MLANSNKGNFAIERLLDRNVFPHDVTELTLLETHISWVILTGKFAYKIKKPVSFDFVDYSSLRRRKDFCFQEVELNRRFAPELYVDVVPIVKSGSQLRVGSKSDEHFENRDSHQPIEYAVKMRQFPQDAIVAARLQNPELTGESIERFGAYIAQFHDSIERANPTIKCVQVERIGKAALDNFPSLRNGFQDDDRSRMLDKIERWTIDQFEKLRPKLERRLKAGMVRRCHGDLHLNNIIQLDERLVAFDGIEFNEEFQWIDVLSEIAFTVMDFVARGRTDLGWRLLSFYLESCGDYADLDVLRFYLVYRAMVRAKVTWLNPKNHPEINSSQVEFAGPWDKYLRTALFFSFEMKPRLAITFGFSGSGKSTASMQNIELEGGIRIRSDIERQRLAQKSKTGNKYSPEMSDWVYAHLLDLAKSTVEAGFPLVIDATFLKSVRRNPFQRLATDRQLDYQIINCDAPFEELCKRIDKRGVDPSEATIDVLKMQMDTHDPLTTDELQYVRDAGNQ